jgi:hypothetical protein
LKRNLRSDAAGFPPGDPPKRNASSFASPDDWRKDIAERAKDNIEILYSCIHDTLESLGGPIHKTITWHMNNWGVFADSEIDINSFYSNLKELVGPGADLIMEETWLRLQKRGSKRRNY